MNRLLAVMKSRQRNNIDLRRRALLKAAPLGLLAACSPRLSSSFSAMFQVAGAEPIAFDYANERNFSFTPKIGWGATRVVDGHIYLVMFASLATAGRERVIWAGDMTRPHQIAKPIALSLQPSAASASRQEAWRLNGSAQDMQWASSDPNVGPTILTIGDLAPLAHAQYVIDTEMRAGMDMRLCGDSVNRLIGTWPSQITAHGLAVLASSGGTGLVSPLMPIKQRPALPPGVEIEDFRIKLARPL